jgi:hypothetical protein
MRSGPFMLCDIPLIASIYCKYLLPVYVASISCQCLWLMSVVIFIAGGKAET